jgi:hypothetical protein
MRVVITARAQGAEKHRHSKCRRGYIPKHARGAEVGVDFKAYTMDTFVHNSSAEFNLDLKANGANRGSH